MAGYHSCFRGQDAAPVIDRLRYHLEQEGRDIASFGLQAQVSTPPGQETDWVRDAKRLRTLGFTHLGFGTLTRGFTPMENLDRATGAKKLIAAALQD